jgi:capsular polysaccharide export protein
VDAAIDALLRNRVGGNYWGEQPPLPPEAYVLVAVRGQNRRAQATAALKALGWSVCRAQSSSDPWHLLGGASFVVADRDSELAVLAAIAGRPVHYIEDGAVPASTAAIAAVPQVRELVRRHIAAFDYFDPFTGDPLGLDRAIELCGFWRRLIDSNRDISGAIGFAFWKRSTVAPLLWRGSGPVRFLSSADEVDEGQRLAIWKARTSAVVTQDLTERQVELVEVEDGFVRSAGLGADCVPPLSIVVDRAGVHFDPSCPSDLERMLEREDMDTDLLERARVLRDIIVASGLSKYATGLKQLERRHAERRHILVAGQVEDDRAVVSGGAGLTSNLELLRRAREIAPDAYLLYKPHPDVEAGHRLGSIPDSACLELADEVVRDEPVSALLDLVDEVHVNTSLAGFEALLRGKPVTTHGVPFYAGWGLTRDLGPVPPRRTRRRTIDELVAAVLLLYPRYLDPITGLPCPPEVLIRRLSEGGEPAQASILVRLRRLQGRLRRRLSAFRRQP